MSGLSIHAKRQLAEQLARELLNKSGQYRFGIPQSVLNAKANEFMRLSDKELQQKFNEYFQSTGLNAKPKDLWDSMGLNLEQKKKAQANMKSLQTQINKKYMRPTSSNTKKVGANQVAKTLPKDVKKEVRQFMITLLQQTYSQKVEEFRNYLLNNKTSFAELGMELHDLGAKVADGLTSFGVVVDRSDTRAEIREKLIDKQAKAGVLADYVDDEEMFNKLFKEYFNEDFDYQTTFDYICATNDFSTSESSEKIEKFNKKLNNITKYSIKSADDYMKNANGAGGLLDLAFNVALMYVSGGTSAIAKYAQMTAKGVSEVAGKVITNVAGKKIAQSTAGQAISQGVGIVSAQTTSAGLNAVAFQGTKVAELVGETVATGHVDKNKVNVIAESAEGLFKFGYVGGAISGPLGMQVKGLTTKLLNSKPIINQILTKGITNKPTALTSVLKDISEHSEAIGEVLKLGTEFGINAGYMAYDEGVSYTDAMKNLAQMDGVSKMVIAMLGGKNLEFLTPKKVQQIKTDLAGYKVNISIYEGQKVYSVKDAKGKETVLATPEELFMFILDKEAQNAGVKAEGLNAKTEVSGSDDKALAKKRAELKAKLNGDQKEKVTTNNVDTTPRNTELYIVNEDGSVTKVDNTSTEVGKEKIKTKSNNEITTSTVLNNSKIVEKGHIFDKNTGKVIKINPDNIKIESSNTGISINDEFGNVLGSVMLKAECIVNGKTYLQFEGLQSNVDGLGIGTKLIQELEKKSIELGHEGRLIAEASPFISNGGNKPRTNLGFYYKLGFRATDSEIDKQITQCIQEGKDIPISLNCFTQIEYVPSKNASNNPLPQEAREQSEVQASNTEKNFDKITARLKNGHVNYTLSTTEDGRNLVKIENSTKLFTANRFDYYEFDKNGNLVKSQTQISEASAKEMFTDFKNAQTRNIRNRGGRLNAGVPIMDMAEGIEANATSRNVRNEVGNTETTVPKIDNILDKVFDETTIPKTKAILEEIGLTKEEIASIDLKDSNKQRAIEAINNTLKYTPKLKIEISKDEILSYLKASNDKITTYLSEEAKFLTDDNCKLLAKHVIFDESGELNKILDSNNSPQVIMELLPVLTQNGKHKLLGSQLKRLGWFLDKPNNVAKITPENIDLLYKINEKIEDKNYALELSDILNFENTTPEFADNYVKEANRFAKFGLKNLSENDLQERINKRKAVSDFLEEYPIDVTTYDYINKQNTKLSGSDVYQLSQYSNKAEVQKFVNSLTKETRTQFIECADFVDKGFPAEKFANLLNEAAKNDFGVIKGGMYDLIVKIMKTGSKDYDGMIDLVMAYKGTKCLSWYGNEKYVQVANGDFKGAAKYVELAKELKMNPEYYKNLISDKNADFNVAVSNLTYIKENGIDINLYDRYILLRDKKFKINNEKIKYLEAQGITTLDDMYRYINNEFESDISVEEFKAKFEYINEFIAKNQNTDWRGLNSDYCKVKFANNELSMKQIRELSELAEIGNLSPMMVLDLLQNANNLKYKFAKKLCADKDFPKDQIAKIIRATHKYNFAFAEKLCADKEFPKDQIASILRYTNKDYITLSEKLCADKDFPKDCIAGILENTNKEKLALSEKLCADKEFPKDQIASILRYTNKDNITLSEKLCADKDFPREYIIKILNYAKDKSNIENIESIMSNSTMKNWMIENLKNGLSVGNIYDLSRTQKMLINERKNAKAVQEKTSKVNKQQKVEVEKSNDILEAENQLAKHGVHPKLAAQYVKMCVENGFINPVKYEAITKLASAGVGIKELKNIFNLAVGNNLSSANGEFRMQIIDDIVTFKQNGVLDDKLAANMSAVKNMTSAELKARLNTKVREQIKARIDGLDTEVKERLNKSGLDVDVIAQKAIAEVKLPKDVEIAPFEKASKIQTVQLRTPENIVGTEKVVLNKFKSEIDQSIWGDEKCFKKWAEDKIKDLMDFDKHSDYTAVGSYSSVNEKRIQGIKDWYKFLIEESSHKDDVFAHLLVIDGLTKEFKPNNANVPPAVSHAAFEATYNSMLEENTSVSFSQIYARQTKQRAIEQFSKGKQNIDGIEGQWVTIPRSKKGESDYDEHIAMVQALAEGSSWCLRFDNAHTYLKGGNLHFFVDKNGNSQVAINETDGEITQIQKRYNQDSTVPVPYANVIEQWANKNNYHGLEDKRKTALEQKPRFDELKTKLNKMQTEKDAIGIFKLMNIEVEILPDGTYRLPHFSTKIENFSLFELGVNENALFKNVSEIQSNVDLNGSGLTAMPNLRIITGNLTLGDNKISNLRNLETIQGQKIWWDK